MDFIIIVQVDVIKASKTFCRIKLEGTGNLTAECARDLAEVFES